MPDQKTAELHQTLKGLNVAYVVYPLVVAGVAAGTAVATGAGANAFTAADVQLVPNTLTTEYWLCAVDVGACSVAETYLVDVRCPIDTTSIYGFRCGLSAVTGNIGTFKPPFPIRCPALTALGARSASVGGADSITLSVLIATGL
jgi:hypothetical protein